MVFASASFKMDLKTVKSSKDLVLNRKFAADIEQAIETTEVTGCLSFCHSAQAGQSNLIKNYILPNRLRTNDLDINKTR